MANSLGLFGTLGNLVNKETLKKISGVATALEGEKP